ncbi:unnamed protein product [Fusarium equiseti]|uniref:Uncharacterized protein n=1 Tax=Fusarium equiseti TaxID=61235 RepID=A0A8J2NEB9_FUSEQ|nr:unnamed protein product [Fusarium equiseti]
MSSSGSSFTSSSLGRPPTYGRAYVSPVDSTWTTPTSGISSISAPTTEGSGTGTSVLDLGPPGFQATIILFQDTADERVVYLGPWEVVGSEQRRVLWQGSYQNELLEHYLPSDTPSDIHPHTLHSRHRPYYDASDMERYVTFQEPHRVRYTTDEGICIHDQYITIRYEFTTVESSIQFQGDLRRKDLVDFYDVDVVWTNVHGLYARTRQMVNIENTIYIVSMVSFVEGTTARSSFDSTHPAGDTIRAKTIIHTGASRYRTVCDLEQEQRILQSPDPYSSQPLTYDI